MMIPLPYKLLGGALVISMVFTFGLLKGKSWQKSIHARQQAQLQSEILDLGDRLSIKTAHLKRLQDERRDLIYDLEQQAHEAEGSDSPGIGSTNGLRRLHNRWNQGSSTAD